MSSYSFLESRASNGEARCEHGASMSGRAGTSRPTIGAPSDRPRASQENFPDRGTDRRKNQDGFEPGEPGWFAPGRKEDRREDRSSGEGMVPKTGLEPARVAPHAPQ